MTPLRYRKTLAAFALLLVLAATYWLMNARCFQLVGELVCRGDGTRAQVALTFDDAPVPQTTEAVLATLAEKQVRGTFFAIGAQMAAQPQLAQRIVAAGHQLANHSWSHPRFLLKSPAFIAREIDDTEAQIRAAGHRGKAYFRPPYGKKLLGLPWALARRGIAYLELRLLDCNPEDPCGVSLDQLRILEAFMLWVILNPDAPQNHSARDENAHNRLRTACCGLGEHFTLKQNQRDRPVQDAALELLHALEPVAARLDEERGESATRAALAALIKEVEARRHLPYRAQAGNHAGFLDYHLGWRERHRATLHEPIAADIEEALKKQAAASLERQKEKEAEPQPDFETYLQNHFAPLQELLQ